MSGYGPESGRRADANRIIEIINRATTRTGARNVDAELSKSLSWDNPRHRGYVCRAFDDVDEAILPGFGELGDARDARSDSGDLHPFVCDSCGHATTFGRTCSRSICARCAQAWVCDRPIKKTAKVRRSWRINLGKRRSALGDGKVSAVIQRQTARAVHCSKVSALSGKVPRHAGVVGRG